MYTDRKMAILDAFMKLVSRFGMDKTTMQDVAKEVGISVGVIYKDFTNKDDLIDAYVQNSLNQLIAECQAIAAQDGPADQLLHEFIISYFKIIGALLTKDRGFYQLLSNNTGFNIFQNSASYKDLIDQGVADSVKKIMERGIAEKTFEISDVYEASLLFLHAFDSFLLQMALQLKNIEVVLPEVERMYQFLIQAIVKK